MMDSEPQLPAGQKMMPLVICLSLIMGVIVAGVVLIGGKIVEIPEEPDGLSYIMTGITVMILLASLVVPAFLMNQQISQFKRTLTPTEYLGIYQTNTIIAYALMEGPAFMNLFVPSPWSLITVAVILALMIIRFAIARQD